jgi:hypothetical protein
MAGETDIIGGVAQGAVAGSAFGVPGAVVGGILGGVGGLFGSKAKKRARRYARRANQLREQTYRLRSFAEQRNLLRQGQVAASAAASEFAGSGADVESSGFQGVAASVYTQMLDNFLIGQSILDKQLQANVYSEKAGKAAAQADTIGGLMGAAAVITSMIPQGGRPDQTALAPVQGAGTRIGQLSTARSFPTEGPGSISGVPLIYSTGP